MEKKTRLLPPERCFPGIFVTAHARLLTDSVVEERLREMLGQARRSELLRMHKATLAALESRDDDELPFHCASLLQTVVDGPRDPLVSPLEQTLRAVISTRTTAPPDLSPNSIFARDVAPMCYALYLLLPCVEAIRREWTLPAAVQTLFAVEELLTSTLQSKDDTLHDASDEFKAALSGSVPRLHDVTQRIVLKLEAVEVGPRKALLHAWRTGIQVEDKRTRIKLSQLLRELMAEEQSEQGETQEEDVMDLSRAAVPI